jgi:hypothetical protein
MLEVVYSPLLKRADASGSVLQFDGPAFGRPRAADPDADGLTSSMTSRRVTSWTDRESQRPTISRFRMRLISPAERRLVWSCSAMRSAIPCQPIYFRALATTRTLRVACRRSVCQGRLQELDAFRHPGRARRDPGSPRGSARMGIPDSRFAASGMTARVLEKSP